MEFRNRTTGALVSEGEFRATFPNTSFPQVLTPEILDSFGYDPVLEGPQAVTNSPYEISVRSGVEQIGGQWFTKYVAGPVFSDYTTEEGQVVTAAEQEAAYRLRKDEEQARGIRNERNSLLTKSDWTQLSDSPANSNAWATYRQALRDVPSQEGFPWEVEWPEKPA